MLPLPWIQPRPPGAAARSLAPLPPADVAGRAAAARARALRASLAPPLDPAWRALPAARRRRSVAPLPPLEFVPARAAAARAPHNR